MRSPDGQMARRAWEGDGRIDLRSVTNSLRQLPYHVAWQRGFRQAATVLNPTIAIDIALETARDLDDGAVPTLTCVPKLSCRADLAPLALLADVSDMDGHFDHYIVHELWEEQDKLKLKDNVYRVGVIEHVITMNIARVFLHLSQYEQTSL